VWSNRRICCRMWPIYYRYADNTDRGRKYVQSISLGSCPTAPRHCILFHAMTCRCPLQILVEASGHLEACAAQSDGCRSGAWQFERQRALELCVRCHCIFAFFCARSFNLRRCGLNMLTALTDDPVTGALFPRPTTGSTTFLACARIVRLIAHA